MSWFKLDDGFHDHPKIVNLTPEAGWLWVRCATWSSRHLTDGVIPTKIARQMAKKRAADELIAAELWTEHGQGYAFHDWFDYQPSAEEVKGRRKANRQRVAAFREKSKESNGASNEGVTHYSHAGGNASVIRPRPVPTRPDPVTTKNTPSLADASDELSRPDLFAEFWKWYPRKVAKIAARAAWDKAVKTTDPSLIIEGARRYATDPNLSMSRKKFIPHPSKWLNQGQWEDEPLPPENVPASKGPSGAAMFTALSLQIDDEQRGITA